MGQHVRGSLGPAGRGELVGLMIEVGARRGSRRLRCRLRQRRRIIGSTGYLAASAREREVGSWALDRSSRPHRSPRRTPAEVERCVCEERASGPGWGPRLIAGQTGVAHSTVHAILRRHGISRAPKAERQQFGRYEWPCPGDLLHMDVKRYPRFRRPGHAITGDRRVDLTMTRRPARPRLFSRDRR